MPKGQQDVWRAKLQHAWRLPTYEAAWAELRRLHQELKRVNEDAARSLAEGLEETLTLHRLGVEVPLESYRRLQQPREADEGVLRLSCRDYRAAAEAMPEAFGLSRSRVSRR